MEDATHSEYEHAEYAEYSDLAGEEHLHPERYCTDAACVTTVIFTVVTCVLGIAGNGAAIWMTGFKMKKSVNTTWFLSLALSGFIFCAALPSVIDYRLKQSWNFGPFMCSLHSFVAYLSIYSSIFILVIISADHCLAVTFPVWAQNQRTVKKASAVVVLVWIASLSLSIPPAQFSITINIQSIAICYIHYEHHHTVVLMHFTFGFLIPLLIIFTCYFILIRKLRANQTFRFTKPYRVVALLITAFFICWLPFQIVSLLVLDRSNHSFSLFVALLVCNILASANSFLNPLIYVFMNNKKRCSFLAKTESAEESAAEATSVEDGLSAAV
ncbi:chemokine-like receptor 1 [Puntigrus tetrazona]|uniref:chemokine-like receptor 1 n=1 Tax=Puntigrus tetrazona TaxID=1606681 RepID=UPI001C8905D6|nr:chemokine-like receptor 1 [Puntigrus tetrazona]